MTTALKSRVRFHLSVVKPFWLTFLKWFFGWILTKECPSVGKLPESVVGGGLLVNDEVYKALRTPPGEPFYEAGAFIHRFECFEVE